MNPNQISIRSRFFILTVFSVLFWLFTGFLVLSLTERISEYQLISTDIQDVPREILQLENAIHLFHRMDRNSRTFHEAGQSRGMEQFNGAYIDLISRLGELMNESPIKRDRILLQKVQNIKEDLGTADSHMKEMADKSRIRGWNEFGLNGNLLRQMAEIDTESMPSLSGAFGELFSELELYLMLPTADRLISLSNRSAYLEGLLRGDGSALQNNAGIIPQMNLLDNCNKLLELDREIGLTPYDGLQSRHLRSMDILMEEARALIDLFEIRRGSALRKLTWGIVIIIVLASIIYGIAVFALGKLIRSRLETLRKSTLELAAGRLPEDIPARGMDEFAGIAVQLNRFYRSLKSKSGFAADLAGGKETRSLEVLGPGDNLANSLINLEKSLQAARAEEEKHRKSREERRWANEGIAKFGEILRIYNKNISTLAENVIREMVNYLDAEAGGFFLTKDVEDARVLELIASFAFDRKKYLQKEYLFGEGLVGTCALEKEKIFLTDIPDDYINISSGLGESKPGCLLLVPLLLEDQILGVTEIASVSEFQEYEIEFVENLAESIASAVSAVEMNMRTSELLEQSQAQAREMAKQEEIMRQHMEELQATQEESARRESEIAGILNGIHNSSYVAEFNMNEELISMNEKFLGLLESPQSQMLGKKYHEIVGISRHTESYRTFWNEITGGKTISRIDKIAVLSGQEVWLRQTFTPIPDKDGNPFKVLVIAADITETVEQRESLEKQSNEITRANIEMKSFSDAVDQALIKCVYSPAGIIIDLNDNFEDATGFTRKEMLGKNNRVFLQRVEKEQLEKIWDDILKDKPYRGVIRRTKPTGEEVWLMSTFTPVKDENGNIFKVFFLAQDITERKLKYQLLEEANREIDRLRKELEGQD